MALQPKWDARPPARRTDTFSKSDNNTLRQILAEGKKFLSHPSLAFRLHFIFPDIVPINKYVLIT